MLAFFNPNYWSKSENMYFRRDMNVDTAFTEAQQDGLFAVEDLSWWFHYRALLIIGLLNKYFDKARYTIDVGGGNGFTTSKEMKAGYKVALLEPTICACANAKKRGIEDIYCGTLDDESIVDDSLEQFTLLDVLEHIEDDKKFLQLIRKKLVLGGIGLITVPALGSLWSSEDVEAGHYRRYNLREIESLIKEAGYELLYGNYFMNFLYLPILIVRVWMERFGILKPREQRSAVEQDRITKAQFERRGGVVDSVLNLLMSIELRKIDTNKRIRYGSSLVVVIKKVE